MIAQAVALQPKNGLQARGRKMSEDEIAVLRNAVNSGFESLRQEIGQLRHELVSKERYDSDSANARQIIKPVCSEVFGRQLVALQDQMIHRRLFEARIYAIAMMLSFIISVGVRFVG